MTEHQRSSSWRKSTTGFDVRIESRPLRDLKFGNTALTSESLQPLSRVFHLRANPLQKENQHHWLWTCPHVPPRTAVVTDHKANPSNALWLGARGFVYQPWSLIVPLRLRCQSHLTAIAAETFSFSLDLAPSCFTVPPPCPHRVSVPFGQQPGSQMGRISCVCLICGPCYLNLLLALEGWSYIYLAASTASIRLTPAHQQPHSLPSGSWSRSSSLPFMAVLFLRRVIYFGPF